MLPRALVYVLIAAAWLSLPVVVCLADRRHSRSPAEDRSEEKQDEAELPIAA